MLTIDGRTGGGSIIRLALGLSIATRTPFRIEHIRDTRPQPGLKEQHVAGVTAAAQLVNAEVSGATLGSDTVTFVPGEETSETVRVNVQTAGSVSLVLQPLLIAAPSLDCPVKVIIDGGATAGKWAPPVPTMKEVLLPLLDRIGVSAAIAVKRHGFYPRGGALVHAEINPATLHPVDLVDPGQVTAVRGISLAAEQLRQQDVAERQRREARRVVASHDPGVVLDITAEYVRAASPGSVLALRAECEHTVLGADAIGERGKRSETIGRTAAEDLSTVLESGAAVDELSADQLVPFLGLAGGEMTLPTVTDHVTANCQVTERFVDRQLTVDGSRVVAE